jgi:hypothetical protein
VAIPAYGGESATAAVGTTTVAPGIPAGVSTGDLMLAVLAGGNTGAWSVSNQGGGSWTDIGQAQIGTTTTAANVQIFSDYYNGSQTAPTFNTPGNNGVGRIIYITGARSADEAGPFAGLSADLSDSSGDVNVSLASGFSTSDDDCLILLVAGAQDDNPTFGATWSNANLASITVRLSDTTTQGNDSSLDVVTGTLASAGAVGTFTNTLTGVGNVAALVLAIRPPSTGGQTVTGVVLTVTPSLPVALLDHKVTGVALSITPSLPAGTVSVPSGQTVTGVALSITPSLPAALLDHKVTGVALSIAPSLPAGALAHTVTGVALSATPSLPAASLQHLLTGVALSITPSLPAGSITVSGATVTGVALSITPSLPAGALSHTLTAVSLSAPPSLPAGTLRHDVTGTALSVAPSLPTGVVTRSLTGVALSMTPTLPAGTVATGVNVVGVALTITPVLPPGDGGGWTVEDYSGSGTISYSADRIALSATGDFWTTSDNGLILHRAMTATPETVLLSPGSNDEHSRLFMLRKSTASNSAFYALILDQDQSHLTTIWRDTDGAVAAWAGENTGMAVDVSKPLWLRITYSGSTATAYGSQDGVTWTQVGTRFVPGLTLECLVAGGGLGGPHTPTFSRGGQLVHGITAVPLSMTPSLPVGSLALPVQLQGVVLVATPVLPVGAVMVGADWHRIDGSRSEDWHLLPAGAGGDWHRLSGARTGDEHRQDDTHSGDWHRQDGSGRGDWHRQE